MGRRRRGDSLHAGAADTRGKLGGVAATLAAGSANTHRTGPAESGVIGLFVGTLSAILRPRSVSTHQLHARDHLVRVCEQFEPVLVGDRPEDQL